MKHRLTKLTAAVLAALALTGCTGGAQETAPSPQSAETTWTLTVGQPEDSTAGPRRRRLRRRCPLPQTAP